MGRISDCQTRELLTAIVVKKKTHTHMQNNMSFIQIERGRNVFTQGVEMLRGSR